MKKLVGVLLLLLAFLLLAKIPVLADSLSESNSNGESTKEIPVLEEEPARDWYSWTGKFYVTAVWNTDSHKNIVSPEVVYLLEGEKEYTILLRNLSAKDQDYVNKGRIRIREIAALRTGSLIENGNSDFTIPNAGISSQVSKEEEVAEKTFQMGQNYATANYGTGKIQDWGKAFEYYKKAAELGNSQAMNQIGYAYANGLGVELNYLESINWYIKASEKNNVSAMINLATAYERGQGLPLNKSKAEEWYKRAYKYCTEFGDPKDKTINVILAAGFLFGLGTEPDLKKGFEFASKFPEDSDAQYLLAICYENGMGVEQDKKKAQEWYLKAAKQFHPVAMTDVGVAYLNGYGVEKNIDEGMKWIQKSIDAGNRQGFRTMGLCLQNGWGVEQNNAEAMKWFQKAAEKGDAEAEHELGVAYLEGNSLEKDLEKGFHWLQKAAGHGNTEAMVLVAACLLNGIGTEKNEAEAIQWFRQGVEYESKVACYKLGYCLYFGIGTEKNEQESKKLMEQATQMGVTEAETFLQEHFTTPQ